VFISAEADPSRLAGSGFTLFRTTGLSLVTFEKRNRVGQPDRGLFVEKYNRIKGLILSADGNILFGQKLAPNNFRKPVHCFIGIHTALLIHDRQLYINC
jgi:hypothetical protein